MDFASIINTLMVGERWPSWDMEEDGSADMILGSNERVTIIGDFPD